VLFAAEVVDASHALLEDAEEVFDVVRGVAVLVDVLAGRVKHGLVLGVFLP
jgi:hypothetical protein